MKKHRISLKDAYLRKTSSLADALCVYGTKPVSDVKKNGGSFSLTDVPQYDLVTPITNRTQSIDDEYYWYFSHPASKSSTNTVLPPTLPVQQSLASIGKRTLAKMTFPWGPLLYCFSNTPAYYFMRDVAGNKHNLKPTTYTEQNMTNDQLKVIDEQVRFRLGYTNSLLLKGGYKEYFDKHPNDTIRFGIDATTLYPLMYGRSYAPNSGIFQKMFTPLEQVEATLGDYKVKLYKGGYEVEDTYDFNVGQGNYNGSRRLYAWLRRLAGEHGHKNTDLDEKKNKFSIKRNLKQ